MRVRDAREPACHPRAGMKSLSSILTPDVPTNAPECLSPRFALSTFIEIVAPRVGCCQLAVTGEVCSRQQRPKKLGFLPKFWISMQ